MTGYQSKKKAAQDKLTVDREQVKQWLEALKTCNEDEWHSEDDFGLAKTYDENKVDQAIASCEQALAQPAQEPVAWGVFEGNLHDMFFIEAEAVEMAQLKGTHAEVKPLYTKEKNNAA